MSNTSDRHGSYTKCIATQPGNIALLMRHRLAFVNDYPMKAHGNGWEPQCLAGPLATKNAMLKQRKKRFS